MSRESLNYGNFEGDTSADSVRESFAKTDNNFKDLYSNVEAYANGEGKTFQTLAQAMSVTPLPSDNTPFKISNEIPTLEDGGYIYLSSETNGYLFVSSELGEVSEINTTKPVSGADVYFESSSLNNIHKSEKLNLIGSELMDSSTPPISGASSDTLSTYITDVNDNKYEDSDYKTTITQIGSVQGQGILAPIPEDYQIDGKSLKIVIRYTSTENISVSGYLKNDGVFVNNGGAVNGHIYKTEDIKTFIIERDYESSSNIFNLYFDENVGAQVVIYSAKLMVNDYDFIYAENTELVSIGEELLNYSMPPIYGSTSDTTSTYTTELSTLFIEPSDYNTTIVQGSSSSVGQSIFAPIPEAQRVVGLPLSLSVKYTSTHDIEVKGYLKNEGIFVNNSNAVDGLLEATTEIKEIILTRDYEDTSTLFNFYLNQDLDATVVIYSAQLKIPENQAPKVFNNLVTTVVEIDNNGVESYNLITNTLRQYTNDVVYGSQHFEFIVKNSTADYNENDIRGLESYRGSERGVVVLRAESLYGVTIKTDGNSTNENFKTPLDYAYTGEEDKLLNDVVSSKKHTFWMHESMDISGFIVRTIDCKYCVHQDTSGEYDSLFENNYFIQEKQNDITEWRVLGLGTRFNQVARYHNNICEFVNNTGNEIGAGTIPMMMFWHNLNNQTSPTTLEMINNKAINCGVGLFTDVGSNQSDLIILEGNNTNLKTSGIEVRNHALNTSNGYNLNFIINENVNYYSLRDTDGGREDIQKTSLPINRYLFQFKNTSGNTLQTGVAVKNDYVNNTFINASDSDFDAVIWRDVLDGEDGYYIPKGKTADVLCVAGTYIKGDYLTINSSGLFVNSSTNIVGVVVNNSVIANDSLIKVLLLN